MRKFGKKQIIVLIVVLVVIFLGVVVLTIFQELKLPLDEKPTLEEIITEEVYSLSGIVSKVDVENNFLMVRPTGEEDEVKVIITEDTKLFKIVYSSGGNPEFVTERVEIAIEDIKEGDRVFIKAKVNIAGKKEIDNIDYIEIL